MNSPHISLRNKNRGSKNSFRNPNDSDASIEDLSNKFELNYI